MGVSIMGSYSAEQLQQIAMYPTSVVMEQEVRYMSVHELTCIGKFAIDGKNIDLADQIAQHLFEGALMSISAPYNVECAQGYQTVQKQLDAVDTRIYPISY